MSRYYKILYGGSCLSNKGGSEIGEYGYETFSYRYCLNSIRVGGRYE